MESILAMYKYFHTYIIYHYHHDHHYMIIIRILPANMIMIIDVGKTMSFLPPHFSGNGLYYTIKNGDWGMDLRRCAKRRKDLRHQHHGETEDHPQQILPPMELLLVDETRPWHGNPLFRQKGDNKKWDMMGMLMV